jgi:hypothetical protein
MSAETKKAAQRRYHEKNRERRNAESRERNRKRYAENPEKILAINRTWRLANLEKARERHRITQRLLDAAHPEKKITRQRKYRIAHPENGRDWQRKNRAAHPEKVEKEREASRIWYAINGWKKQEQNKKRASEWYAANKERALAATRKLRKEHPERKRIYETRRRVRKFGNGGSHTVAEWIVLCWASAWRCLYCRTGPLGEKTAVQEHKTPLVRGGSDDIKNIAISCARCNSRKGSKTAEEFMAQLSREIA